jgi:CTP:molybdopterin cytidylyltransferase MocA
MSGTVAGLLLAAGAGRRMGRPKAQLVDERGVPFVDRAVGVLFEGGCATVTVVLGAEAEESRRLLGEAGWIGDEAVHVVVADDWDEGMAASLRRGLAALLSDSAASAGSVAALVSLVDLPDVSPAVVSRMLSRPVGPGTLARASYGGVDGHPVVIGRAHWEGVVASARGDRGARDYLAAREVDLVECGDLATGRDVDRPADLP